MINVLLCSYNNYYNRIVKKLDTVNAYRTATVPLFIDLENVNFNPGDGVTTDLVVGKGVGAFLNWETQGPDYCIVYEKINNVETIKSRWFIMDENRTRSGQYKLSLRRDVLADNLENINNVPMYVEKGIIRDLESPLLCNNEGLVVNKIKKNEIPLKDKSACPWLVMYLKKGALGPASTVGPNGDGKVTINIPAKDVIVYEELNTPIASWPLYQYTTNDYNVMNSYNLIVKFYINGTIGSEYFYTMTGSNSNIDYKLKNPLTNLSIVSNWSSSDRAAFKSAMDTAFRSRYSYLGSLIGDFLNLKGLSTLMNYNEKIIKDSNGRYYAVHVENTGNTATNTYNLTGSAVKNGFNAGWNAANNQSASGNDYAYQSKVTSTAYRIRLEELTNVETTVDFRRFTGTGLIDSPLYDVIAMPYGTVKEFIGFEVATELTTDADRSMKVMNSIASQLSSQWCLDLQILPFCPVSEVLNDYYDEEGEIAVLDYMIETVALFGYNLNGTTDCLLVPTKATYSLDINTPINITDNSEVPGTFKQKYLNDCTLVRLCSPNYNGLFDFNLAKNGGTVDFFNIDVTLRPINPYIHVNPNFSNLYGKDWDDVRGLICGGDFSLGIVNDAWTQYEIQNKNYQAIFDRQIQNLDVNNAINRQEAVLSAGAGLIRGGIEGAIAGGTMGGYGVMAGAAIGLTASGLGAALDIANLDKRQREQRDYAIDNFNLQLGNVRALPNSITKTSCLTANNKLFPFVEIYECTDVEKEAYYNKLKYDGMTVGKIDILANYRDDVDLSYFKGRIIRCDTIAVDNHILNEINNELQKGVYL